MSSGILYHPIMAPNACVQPPAVVLHTGCPSAPRLGRLNGRVGRLRADAGQRIIWLSVTPCPAIPAAASQNRATSRWAVRRECRGVEMRGPTPDSDECESPRRVRDRCADI